MGKESSYPLCLHIKTNGVRCLAPALKSRDWCYFHANLHGCHRAIRRLPAGSPPTHLRNLPPLEDHEAIQVSISAVFASLAAGHLDSRNAYALFYGLQLAAANVRHTMTDPYNRGKTVMIEHAVNQDGLHLADPSREPESPPELVAVPAPVTEAPAQAPDPAPVERASIDTPPAPCRSPLNPRLTPDRDPDEPRHIRSSISDRLKVRAPYNFHDEVLARE